MVFTKEKEAIINSPSMTLAVKKMKEEEDNDEIVFGFEISREIASIIKEIPLGEFRSIDGKNKQN